MAQVPPGSLMLSASGALVSSGAGPGHIRMAARPMLGTTLFFVFPTVLGGSPQALEALTGRRYDSPQGCKDGSTKVNQ